jgi:hypothetical protein
MLMPADRRRNRKPAWADYDDEQLLDLRFSDLGLEWKGLWLESELKRLHGQLERRGLRFRPHAWLSTEWFSPVGIPGIAMPFYLAHPRLIRLERRLMLEVEGGRRHDCQRLLRHECGHAIQQAFRLHRRKLWRDQFGSSGQEYPDSYRPNPRSRRHVQHLRLFYAQSHPDEDFAETFAVWLGPRHLWRKAYAGWPALEKLEYVDQLMHSLADRIPPVRSRRFVRSLASLDMTLREHYSDREERYRPRAPSRYDSDLRSLFGASPRNKRAHRAARLLRSHRAEIRRRVARFTGEHQQVLDNVLSEMILRCKELQLCGAGSEQSLLTDFSVLLAARTMAALHADRDWIAV